MSHHTVVAPRTATPRTEQQAHAASPVDATPTVEVSAEFVKEAQDHFPQAQVGPLSMKQKAALFMKFTFPFVALVIFDSWAIVFLDSETQHKVVFGLAVFRVFNTMYNQFLNLVRRTLGVGKTWPLPLMQTHISWAVMYSDASITMYYLYGGGAGIALNRSTEL